MTIDEVKRLLVLNMNNFPGRFLKDADESQMRDMAKSWYAVFAEVDAKLVFAAYMEALKHCSFPVTIADIWREIEKTIPAPEPEQEWQALLKAANWCYKQSYWRTFSGPSMKYKGLTQGQEYERDCQMRFDALSEVNKNFIGNVRRLVELGSKEAKEQDFWYIQRYKPAFDEYQRFESGSKIVALVERQEKQKLLS